MTTKKIQLKYYHCLISTLKKNMEVMSLFFFLFFLEIKSKTARLMVYVLRYQKKFDTDCTFVRSFGWFEET